ncbi:MAG: diacylglycerol kinase [Desulfofustis sp.]|nr:diacylglycerol kinase [Desulfofustis sp.]
MNKPPTKQGLARIIGAAGYSLSGLKACFVNEAAFRQEVLFFTILLPILFLLPVSGFMKIVLLLVNTLVLIVELLNSAIEAIVDKASPELNDLAKRAKDMGSAAVLLSLLVAGAAWVVVLSSVLL